MNACVMSSETLVCMLPPYVLEYYLLFLSEAAIVSCFAGGRQCDSYYYRWRFGCGCLCGRTRGPRGRERLFGPEIFTAGTGDSLMCEYQMIAAGNRAAVIFLTSWASLLVSYLLGEPLG